MLEFHKMDNIDLVDIIETGIKKAKGIAGLYSAAATSDEEMDRDTLVCAAWALQSLLIDVDQAHDVLRSRTSSEKGHRQ